MKKQLGFIGVLAFIAMASVGLGQVFDQSGRQLYAVLSQGLVSTALPAYSNGASGNLSIDPAGGLRTIPTWPVCSPGQLAIHAEDSLRFKIWNSAGCVNSASACESAQIAARIRFRRKDTPRIARLTTKILTMDNDRGAAGAASSGSGSFPFGAAASKQLSVSDADSPGTSNSITACTPGTPTSITVSAHGYATGRIVLVNLTSSPNCNTPTIPTGPYFATITGATTMTLPVTTSAGSGAGGAIYTSQTITSASAPFVVATATARGSAGKALTLSTGGVICTGSDDPCQGPKFPTLYEGHVVAVASTTSATVSPSILIDPAGSGTLKLEPILNDDTDGQELGDGCLEALDINFWGTGQRIGQTYVEAEINRGPWDMHMGFTLACDFIETSHHLSWTGGTPICRHKTEGAGWDRTYVLGTTAGSSAPTAGADWTITVPPNAHWELTGITAVFTAGNVVINRLPSFVVDDGANVITSIPAVTLVQTGATHSITATVGAQPGAVLGPTGAWAQTLTMPYPLKLKAGFRIRSSTTNIQNGGGAANDVWSNVVLTLTEKPEEAGG